MLEARQTKWESIKWLVIDQREIADEISMLGQQMWGWLDSRLRELEGRNIPLQIRSSRIFHLEVYTSLVLFDNLNSADSGG